MFQDPDPRTRAVGGEEAPIKGFWVILVIAAILAAALAIFRLRPDAVADRTVHQEKRDQVVYEVNEAGARFGAEAGNMLGN